MRKLISSDQKPLVFLAFFMAIFVTASNFLVQYPINFFGMEEFLTYGAITYPVTFLITDLSNRRYGKLTARKIVYMGFILGILLTLFFSTNFSDLISIRIAIGSGTAFLFAQLLDVQIFDKLRRKIWFAAPFTSSFIGSLVDTFIFFSIAFYGSGVNWVTLGIGDFLVKVLMALTMLIPFRILMVSLRDFSKNSIKPSSI
ncbi:MAG: hypothetical protein CBD56_02050 [Candidatus Pelagibacter sp. TMED196]|nr:MAG: hypothetical protein CBD56_02050 [Candidatus Pelagibacter sp. TMED196]|tara:strand:+ start:2416 stop:3015 length:600 start_codon:yes stop_codon:yes gene_type:complete